MIYRIAILICTSALLIACDNSQTQPNSIIDPIKQKEELKQKLDKSLEIQIDKLHEVDRELRSASNSNPRTKTENEQ